MTATKVPLASLVEQVKGSVPPEKLLEGDYVLLEHISQKTGRVSPSRVELEEIKSAKGSFAAGDVLYGKLRPQLRKVCVAERSGFCSLDIIVLRPVALGTAHYLAAVLRSEGFTDQVARLVGGANLPRINARELLNLELEWPDDEREVSRRDTIARRALEVRSEAQLLLEQLDRLELSIL